MLLKRMVRYIVVAWVSDTRGRLDDVAVFRFANQPCSLSALISFQSLSGDSSAHSTRAIAGDARGSAEFQIALAILRPIPRRQQRPAMVSGSGFNRSGDSSADSTRHQSGLVFHSGFNRSGDSSGRFTSVALYARHIPVVSIALAILRPIPRWHGSHQSMTMTVSIGSGDSSADSTGHNRRLQIA